MRYTITNLRADIDRYNSYMLGDGINTFFREQGRNFYQAADCYKFDRDGSISLTHMIGGGTSREVSAYCREEYNRSKFTPINRIQAYRMLAMLGFSFDRDYFTLSHSEKSLLSDYRKYCKYSYRSASGRSQNYSFYLSLVRIHKRLK